jgi:FkbH-like protein
MDALDGILQAPGRVLRQAVEHAAGVVRSAELEDEALRRLAPRTDTAALWIRALLLEPTVPPPEAEALYACIVDPAGREIPDVLLRRARLARRAGDAPRAAGLLRQALRLQPGYAFFPRAETVARKLKGSLPARRLIRLALVGSCTTSLLRSVLELLFFRDGIEAEIYEAPFGVFRQEIGDPGSGLHRFAPGFVVLLLNWRDAGLPFLTGEPGPAAERVAGEIHALWDGLLGVHSCQVIQPLFDIPPSDPFLALSSLLPGGRASMIGEINRLLGRHAPPGVTLLDTPRLAATHAVSWDDPVTWSAAKLHPSPDALPLLGEEIVSVIRGALGLSSKLIAVDLDNTLWGGVIGEDGMGGIVLGPPSPLGERFQELHRYLQGLAQRGILLAVVSKNNLGDAEEVFRRHDSAILRMEDFVMFLANWDQKPANLRRLAETLALGTDSFVFLDDNPAERAAVRAELPDAIVPEISGEPSETIAALERGRYFQAIQFTPEDASRGVSYAARARLQEARHSEGGDYLLDLGMEIEWGAVDPSTAARVAQLINKTNQFNLTTRRYTQPEVEAFMASPRRWFRWFRLRDRFADHGLVAVLLAERAGELWTVDLWLMSCRTIGRGVEQFMFNKLVEAARADNAARIEAAYLPTAKNRLVEDLLPRLGFRAIGEDARYRLRPSEAVLLPCPGLREAVAR